MKKPGDTPAIEGEEPDENADLALDSIGCTANVIVID